MLGDLMDLAKTGGRIAREHFTSLRGKDVVTKRPRDYVSHVDRLVEETLVNRIRARFPNHQVLGEDVIIETLLTAYPGHGIHAEESGREHGAQDSEFVWIIDPLDGTTNFIHGIPVFAVSIAFCEPDNKGGFTPRHGIVYDPMRDEAFTGEANAGVWLNGERVWTSGCATLSAAVVATALPFRFPAELDAAAAVFLQVQKACDDQRRGGSAALDLAYTAVGRLDGYYELGIYPWDTAAGELLVRGGGGVVTDWHGETDGILTRRSIVAGASAPVHAELLAAVAPLRESIARVS